ncbi:hypothetical protein BpHYR1_029746, partial [Brachionus plicatilis]
DIITTTHKPIVLAIAKRITKLDDIIKLVNENFDGLTPPKRHNKRVGECIRKVNKDELIIIYLISLNELLATDDLKINDKLAKLQKEDAEIQESIQMVLSEKEKNRTGKRFKQLVVLLRKDILELCHDNFTRAHLGQKKTWIKLSNSFF